MYIPSFNRIDDDDEVRRFVAAARSAQFVTVDPEGLPVATLLVALGWEARALPIGGWIMERIA